MSRRRQGGGSLTVLLALAANLAVAVIKAVAGVISGSAALLSESAHSFGDTLTEVLLVTAQRRSIRPADRTHPFGYGKERYFWSLLAALGIFTLGAGFSIYQGVSTLVRGEPGNESPLAGYIVVGLAMLMEAVSLTQAVRHVRHDADRLGMTAAGYVRDPDDPTVKSVVLEDSAAIVGLLLALAGLALRQITGSPVWDGIAALCIAALLVTIAYELARTNMGLLIGKQANPVMLERIRRRLTEHPEVLEVVDLLTMMLGSGKILLCVRLDFIEQMSADEVEEACVLLHRQLREDVSQIDEIFLEPVPRTDESLRRRAVNRDRA